MQVYSDFINTSTGEIFSAPVVRRAGEPARAQRKPPVPQPVPSPDDVGPDLPTVSQEVAIRLLPPRRVVEGGRGAWRPTGAGLVNSAISARTPFQVSIYENCIEVKSSLPRIPKTSANSPLVIALRSKRVQSLYAERIQRYERDNHPDDPLEPAPKRGRISKFSRRSRARLMRKVNKSPRIREGGFFVTLTYPHDYPEDFEVYKHHLKLFFDRLFRLAKKQGWNLAAMWKLEFQERGAPHYHLMVFGMPDKWLWKFRDWVSAAWFEVVNSGDEKHFRAGTNVRFMQTTKHVSSYVSKYLGKGIDQGEDGYTGRFWGFRGDWDFSAGVVLFLEPWQMVKFRRLISGHLRRCGRAARAQGTGRGGKGALDYARRLDQHNMGAFFVVGLGEDTPFILRALANLHLL